METRMEKEVKPSLLHFSCSSCGHGAAEVHEPLTFNNVCKKCNHLAVATVKNILPQSEYAPENDTDHVDFDNYSEWDGVIEGVRAFHDQINKNNSDNIEIKHQMSRDEYLVWFKKTLDEMYDLTARKNADYAGVNSDTFFNFTRVEALGIASTEVGFLTRMTDKMSRIVNFVHSGDLQVKSESVQDTLKDLAIYSILMMAYLETKPKKAEK